MHALDNPIWTALTTRQAMLAHSGALARRFPPEMTLLGALAANTAMAFDSLAQLIQRDPVTLYFHAASRLPGGWTVMRAVELRQMVKESSMAVTSQPASSPTDKREMRGLAAQHPIVELTPADVPEMSELYTATRPGRALTPRIQKLGTFLGIRQEGRLLAMAGLRLHITGYREITTVATMPGFEGRGYATALLLALIARIESRGDRPFLTVRSDNTRAAAIYQRLGFLERRLLYSQTIRQT
jgi:ribosomal protein S18 acetylase RimI-like enzyme